MITFETVKSNKLAHSIQIPNSNSTNASSDSSVSKPNTVKSNTFDMSTNTLSVQKEVTLTDAGSTIFASTPTGTVSPAFEGFQPRSLTSSASSSASSSSSSSASSSSSSQGAVVSPADGFVFENVVRVFHALQSFGLADLDKVVRSQPRILLETETEVSARLTFLCDFFVDAAVAAIPMPILAATRSVDYALTGPNISSATCFTTSTSRSITPTSTVFDNASISEEWLDAVYKKMIAGLNSLLLAYPYMLAIEYK